MAHFVVVGDDVAGTAAALTIAEMGLPVTLLLDDFGIPIPDMWSIGATPLNNAPMKASEWYKRQYEWINGSDVRWLYNTPGFHMICDRVEQDAETGELVLSDGLRGPSVRATAAVFTSVGRSSDLPAELQADQFFGRGLSWSAWSDGHFFHGKPVAVFGCGAHAAEQACDLAPFASRVTVLCEEPEFAIPADLLEVTWLSNVELHSGVTVSALVPGADGRITGVEFQREGAVKSVEAAAVFVAYNPELSWEIWGSRDRALDLIKQQRLYLAGVPAGVPYRDHFALFEDGQRAAREAAERWGGA